MDIPGSYFYRQYHPMFVTRCVCFICKLPLMLSLDKHSALWVCCRYGLFYRLTAGTSVFVVIVLIFDPSVDSFLDMVRKYTDITELTAEIIRTFVEKIEVMKPEKVPSTRTKKQTIVIHWNFIGAVEIPDTKEKTA